MTPGRRRAGALLPAVCALAIAGCRPGRPAAAPATPSTVAVRPPSPAVVSLRRDIDTLLAEPALARGTWGVVFRSLTAGDTLYALNPRRLLTPASNLKIVTLAVSADELGPDYTFETQARAAGTIESGTLEGDLVVAGTGDPSLSEDDGSAQQMFSAWADGLKTIGIRAISGRVIGDDNAFDDDPFGSGWMWDDMDQAYSAGIGALQLNVGAMRLTVAPGPQAGAPALITPASEGGGLTIRNRVLTAAAGSPAQVVTRRPAGGTVLEITGSVPADAPPLQRTVAVANPTLYFVSEMRKALTQNGIEIRGKAVDIDDLADPPLPERTTPLLTHRSPPLAVLADTLMKASQNQYAETLLKALGARAGTPTFDGGRKVVRETMAAWGVPPSDLFYVDGSGLSRYNLITAEALVSTLAHVHEDDRLRAAFEAALPVAGVAGTLSDRLAGTAAAGRIHAKTGSMLNVRSISGFLQTADGEPIVFSIVANNYGVPAADIDRVSDAVLLKVAQFRR
jgi:D-alanyl-D-alanine carboxypeptidase/D-alanyl-D-alanine-endopeptidase (penicillin-binding protein 4)